MRLCTTPENTEECCMATTGYDKEAKRVTIPHEFCFLVAQHQSIQLMTTSTSAPRLSSCTTATAWVSTL